MNVLATRIYNAMVPVLQAEKLAFHPYDRALVIHALEQIMKTFAKPTLQDTLASGVIFNHYHQVVLDTYLAELLDLLMSTPEEDTSTQQTLQEQLKAVLLVREFARSVSDAEKSPCPTTEKYSESRKKHGRIISDE
jgi:hypothetical protein